VREGASTPLETAVDIGRAPSQQEQLQLRDFRRALDQLPHEQRAVVLLIGLEGLRYEEVADILNVPVGTIRSRLSRARDLLRQLMDAPERRASIGRSKSRPAAGASGALPRLYSIDGTLAFQT
jgi:DNA-directed RNA polymerase specialized sigma24 family protein